MTDKENFISGIYNCCNQCRANKKPGNIHCGEASLPDVPEMNTAM